MPKIRSSPRLFWGILNLPYNNKTSGRQGDSGMRYTYSDSDRDVNHISEMAIVDTFTRLIFADDSGFDLREELIIETFRTVDANVLLDSYVEMGEYLRNLGVREMIHLVSRIREQVLDEVDAAMSRLSDAKSMGANTASRRDSH
jgi:hypothetical protein